MKKWSFLVYILFCSQLAEATDQFKLDWALGTEAAKKDANVEEIRTLVERGGDPNTLSNGTPPLIFAIRHHHSDLFDYLLNLPMIDPNLQALGESVSSLDYAIRSGNLHFVERLLNRWDVVPENSIEPRLFASMTPRILNSLLRIKPYLVNMRDSNGNTPLHYAVLEGNILNVKILLYRLHRADLSAMNHEGNTPLDLARKHRLMNMLKFLEEEKELSSASGLVSRSQEREFISRVDHLISDFEDEKSKKEKMREMTHYEIQIKKVIREIKIIEKHILEKIQYLKDSKKVLRNKIEKEILDASSGFIRNPKTDKNTDKKIDSFTSTDHLAKKLTKGHEVYINKRNGQVKFTSQSLMDEELKELESLRDKHEKLRQDLERFKVQHAQLKKDLDDLERKKQEKEEESEKNKDSKEKEEEKNSVKEKDSTNTEENETQDETQLVRLLSLAQQEEQGGESSSSSSAQSNPVSQEPDHPCGICAENSLNCAYIPCGHLLCSTCKDKIIERGSCHICNQAFSAIVFVYLSASTFQ